MEMTDDHFLKQVYEHYLASHDFNGIKLDEFPELKKVC